MQMLSPLCQSNPAEKGGVSPEFDGEENEKRSTHIRYGIQAEMIIRTESSTRVVEGKRHF